MLYLARIPSARLAPFVDSMWYFASASASVLESVVPDGTMQLLVNLDADRLRWYTGAGYAAARSVEGAALSGCQPTHFAIDVGEQRKMVGVKFKPGGAAPFLKVPAHELCALNVPLADLWAGGSEVREQLLEHSGSPHQALATLERLLLARLDEEHAPAHPAVLWAIEELKRGAAVGALVSQLGWTPHRFIRHFEACVGLKPKVFQRISRFQRALTLGREGDWAGVAADIGYADQAHLIRDFYEFAGATPSVFVQPDIPTPEPVARHP